MRRLFPGRFALAGIMLAAFAGVGFLTRLALLVQNGDASLASPATSVTVPASGPARADFTFGN